MSKLQELATLDGIILDDHHTTAGMVKLYVVVVIFCAYFYTYLPISYIAQNGLTINYDNWQIYYILAKTSLLYLLLPKAWKYRNHILHNRPSDVYNCCYNKIKDVRSFVASKTNEEEFEKELFDTDVIELNNNVFVTTNWLTTTGYKFDMLPRHGKYIITRKSDWLMFWDLENKPSSNNGWVNPEERDKPIFQMRVYKVKKVIADLKIIAPNSLYKNSLYS
jgi:hypothetical protein